MHTTRWLLLSYLILDPLPTLAAVAMVLSSGDLTYSSFEHRLDESAGTTREQLQQLENLEDAPDAALPAHRAVLLLYRCFLQASQDKTSAQETANQLQNGARLQQHPDFLPASTLCDSYRLEQQSPEQNFLASGRAWQQLSPDSGRMLRYWVADAYSRDALAYWRPDASAEAAAVVLAIARANQFPNRSMRALATMALAQADMALYDAALQNISEAIQLAGDKPATLGFRLNRGYILLSAGRLDEARADYEHVRKQALQEKRIEERGIAESNLVEIYARSGQAKEALQLADDVLANAPTGQQEVLAYTRVFRGIALQDLGNAKEAERSFHEGQRWFAENQIDMARATNMGFWADALARQNRFAAAFAIQKQKEALLDKARRHIREREVVLHKAASDLEKKDREILALNHANTVQQLEIENRTLQQQRWTLLGGVATSLLALAIWLLLKLRKRTQQLDWQSAHDPLTGVYNRRGFERFMADRIPDAQQDVHTRAVLMVLDIDHFKRINDTWGHDVGDAVLRNVASRLASCVRSQDRIVRWGGEEFLLYLDAVREDHLPLLCHRILDSVRELPIPCGSLQIPVTVSAGFSAIHPGQSWSKRLTLADQALYAAKQAGRNQAKGHLRDDDRAEWV